MEREQKRKLDQEMKVLFFRYLALYGSNNLQITVNGGAGFENVKIKVSEEEKA